MGTSLIPEIARQVQSRGDELVRVCQELVRHASPNPPGDTRSVAGYVAAYLESVGVPVDWITCTPEKPNLLARLNGARPGRHLTLCGHMDTFPIQETREWTRRPTGGQVEGDRIYGRGASDMKGGLAAAMVAMATLAEYRQELAGRLDLLAVSSHETMGAEGAPFVLAQRPDVLGDGAITPEPLYHDAVGCGEKGFVWLEVTARSGGGPGFAAGSTSSAIELLLEALHGLRRLGNWRCELPHRLAVAAGSSRAGLERVTSNVGVITGGEKVNLLADHACAQVDVRLPLGLSCADVLHVITELWQHEAGLSWRVISQSEPNLSPPAGPLFECLAAAQAAAGLEPLPAGMYLPASDARLFRHLGIPAVSYGPAACCEASPDEHVRIPDLAAVATVLAVTACTFCAGDDLAPGPMAAAQRSEKEQGR